MSNSSLWIALAACAMTWTGCLAPTQPGADEVTHAQPPLLEPPPPLLEVASEPEPAQPATPAPRRTWLRYESPHWLDSSWITRPPSANLYPRWEQLLDQRRLSDGMGLRLGEGSSLGALWTSEDGPAGVVAFRREF